MRDELELTLLGSPEVRLESRPVTGFRSSKAQALLYYLAVTGRPQARATLGGLLWGDQPETAARASLSKCLSNLHELLGDAVLIERQTVAFNRAHPYQLDTERFAAHAGTRPTRATIQSLQAALAVYRGDFLEGFYVRDAPDFEQWVLRQRADYREAVVNGLHALATYAEQQGDLPQAAVHTRRLLALEPWREEAHRHLMVVLARNGQRAAALAQFETCRRILNDELAVEPDAETLTLAEAIRAGDFDTVTGWQGDKVNGAQDRPVTLSPPQHVTYPLPIPPTPLIGRERELAELNALISDPACKLITICGPGGMGKTRLALAAAAAQGGKFQHGALFVPLVGVSTAQFLPQAILSALEVPLRGEFTPLQQVRALLYGQERLLVLDNYEHLLPEIDLLLDLLHHAPGITVLVTSRERLALRAEHLQELVGIDYPPNPPMQSRANSPPELTRYAAVQLFLQRVRQTRLRFTPNDEEMGAIVRICQITEGMPLALELAAAAVREQAVVALAAALEAGQTRLSSRLRDLPERHRTIEAVFEHSWHLLSVSEQQVLAALAVFRGGFEVEAAQTVAGATPVILAGLMDRSWLRCHPNGRYDIHELVRQYAHEQLVICGKSDAVQWACTHYFLQFAQAAKAGIEAREPNRWMLRAEQELDNLRSVLKWLVACSPEDGLRMLSDLFLFWRSGGHFQEGYDWFRVALAQSESVALLVRAHALIEAGFLAICKNEIVEAEELFGQSLLLCRQLDGADPRAANVLAYALNCQSLGPLFRGDYQQAVHLCRQALAVAQQSGEPYRATQALYFMGEALYLQALFDQSRRAYEESLSLFQAAGTYSGGGMRFVRLGHVACAQDELAQANMLFKKGLKIVADHHDLVGIGMALIGHARMAALRGDYQRATLLMAANEEMTAINPIVRHWPMDRIENGRTLAILHAHLDDAAFAAAWTAGCAMTLEQAIAYALAEPAP